MTFIPGEQGTKVKFWVEQGTRQYWGTSNIRKQFSILGEQGNKPIYFRGTRERLSPYEGLISVPIFKPSTSLFVCSSVCQHVILNCVSEALTAVNVKTCILIVLCILFKNTLQFVTPYHDQHHICSRVCSRDIWSVIVVLGILLKHALCHKSHISLIFMIL